MIKYENDCVGPCPQGCIRCGRASYPHMYCDECDAEVEVLYKDVKTGEELCEECALAQYEKIEL